MKSRLLIATAATLVCAAILMSQRQRSRLAAQEEQITILQLRGQRDQFREENVRLRADNRRLQAELQALKTNSLVERVSPQDHEDYYPTTGLRNPELMRRYFPHLFKDKTNQAKPEEVPAPPKE